MTIDIFVAHAGWDANRTASTVALGEALGEPKAFLEVSAVREHANVWAVRLWEAAIKKSTATHAVFLNDDVTVPPFFRAACEAITTAVPDEVISLHTSVMRNAAIPRWQRSYWLTGPGYIIPRAMLGDLLAFADARRAWFEKKVNEDGLIMQWAWANQRPIWHCVPALVKHDPRVPSTLGYDNHAMRVTNTPWDAYQIDPRALTSADAWRPDPSVAVETVPCPWRSESQFRVVEMRKGQKPRCAFCDSEDVAIESFKTAAALCFDCIASSAHSLISRRET